MICPRECTCVVSLLHTKEVIDVMKAIFPALFEQLMISLIMCDAKISFKFSNVLFWQFKGCFSEPRLAEGEVIGLVFFGVGPKYNRKGGEVSFFKFLELVVCLLHNIFIRLAGKE